MFVTRAVAFRPPQVRAKPAGPGAAASPFLLSADEQKGSARIVGYYQSCTAGGASIYQVDALLLPCMPAANGTGNASSAASATASNSSIDGAKQGNVSINILKTSNGAAGHQAVGAWSACVPLLAAYAAGLLLLAGLL